MNFGETLVIIMKSILYPFYECSMIFKVLFIDLFFKVLSFVFRVLGDI